MLAALNGFDSFTILSLWRCLLMLTDLLIDEHKFTAIQKEATGICQTVFQCIGAE